MVAHFSSLKRRFQKVLHVAKLLRSCWRERQSDISETFLKHLASSANSKTYITVLSVQGIPILSPLLFMPSLYSTL